MPAAGGSLRINDALGNVEITRDSETVMVVWSVAPAFEASHIRLEIQAEPFTADCRSGVDGLPGTGMRPITPTSVSLPIDSTEYDLLDDFYVRGCLYDESSGMKNLAGGVTNTVQVAIQQGET